MKNILFLAVTLLLLTACQETLEERAKRTMQDYTEKNCPMPLSQEITMDSCAFETATHTLHYYYTLMGSLDNDSLLNKDAMRQTLVEALKNETSTRIFKEAGYNFKYTYYSQQQHGQVLFETVMTKEDYQ